MVDRRGERLIVAHGGAQRPEAIARLPFARLEQAGSALADCTWPDASLAVFEAARRNGVPSVLDAEEHESANLLTLARAADLPIFSKGAARVLCGAATTPATIGALAQAMPGDFGVTLGARGSLWRIDGAIHEIPALDVVSVDTTGAGDVFHGAVAAGLAERMPLLEAVRFASACAGLKCAH
jgi:sulfofructose kinase